MRYRQWMGVFATALSVLGVGTLSGKTAGYQRLPGARHSDDGSSAAYGRTFPLAADTMAAGDRVMMAHGLDTRGGTPMRERVASLSLFAGPGTWSTLLDPSAGLLAVGAGFIGGQQVFPSNNPWNQDISGQPVDPNSANLIASIGLNTGLHPDFGAPYNGAPNGIPYTTVSGTQPRVPVSFDYADESDPGPYPIPPNAPVEAGGDRHVLVIDRDNGKLYEMFNAYKVGAGWRAGSGAVFDLRSNALRPAGWTSADAAGLPIFPGLVRYDEVVQQGAINHALRFTVSRTRRGYVHPARHFASSNTSANLPPMGMRVRLKANFNVSSFPQEVRVILTALKRYGMFVADNGSNWYISGAPDNRWNDSNLSKIRTVRGSNFEVVRMGPVTTR